MVSELISVESLNLVKIVMRGFESASELESMADFIPQDILEPSFIMNPKTVMFMAEDSEDIAEFDKSVLREALKQEGDLYLFEY